MNTVLKLTMAAVALVGGTVLVTVAALRPRDKPSAGGAEDMDPEMMAKMMKLSAPGEAHKPTRALARESLLDWEAIFRVLVCLRIYRSPTTTRSAPCAIVGDRSPHHIRNPTLTGQPCSDASAQHHRNLLSWPYLAEVIAERRKGQPAPPIPAHFPQYNRVGFYGGINGSLVFCCQKKLEAQSRFLGRRKTEGSSI